MSAQDEIFDAIEPVVSAAAGRIFFASPPDNYTYEGPYVVIRGVGATSEEEIGGQGVGLGGERMEFSCRAKVEDGGNTTCREMADQIRRALQKDLPGPVLHGASFAGRIDLYDLDLDLHVVPLDMEITYSEEIA